MWTFLAVLGSGTLAAASALVSAWLTNRMGADRDKQRYDHEKELAREARFQERLGPAYIELGTYLSHYADWARAVQPLWGPVPAPDPLPQEERWRVETLVTVHGSPEVRRLLEQWAECAQRIENADIVIRMAKQSRDPGVEFDQKALREEQALPGYKEAMHKADAAIRDRMSLELRDAATSGVASG